MVEQCTEPMQQQLQLVPLICTSPGMRFCLCLRDVSGSCLQRHVVRSRMVCTGPLCDDYAEKQARSTGLAQSGVSRSADSQQAHQQYMRSGKKDADSKLLYLPPLMMLCMMPALYFVVLQIHSMRMSFAAIVYYSAVDTRFASRQNMHL